MNILDDRDLKESVNNIRKTQMWRELVLIDYYLLL